MARIIAGSLGGMRLKSAASATRPTSDRVKESIFSSLEAAGFLVEAKVLDLYAGTGALGLEAASRGAREVVFVERDKAAVSVCKENIALAHQRLQALNQPVLLTLFPVPAKTYLARKNAFDIAFIDPPYDQPASELEQTLSTLFNDCGLQLAIVERSSKSNPPLCPGSTISSQKNFGDTTVYFLARGGAH